MKKLIFAVISIILLISALIFFIINSNNTNNSDKLSIVSTNFIGYDLARAVIGDENTNITMLLPPGSEAHSFDPTPGDIINIKNADLFIYNGGESEDWVENLIADNQIDKNKTLRLMDTVELKQEEANPDEYDEHIWTSIPNTTKMLTAIKDKLIQIDPKNTNTYERQAASYVQKLTELDQEIRSIVANSSRKELVFADRFPFLYFVTEYGLDYTAAFPGCSEQTEASSQTISTLIDKVKKGHIPVILKIEMTPDNLAQTISEATNAKILTLYSAHNISAEDFEKGTTYLDLLEKNVDTLKKALN